MTQQTLFGGVGATLPASWSDRSIYTFISPDDRGAAFFANIVATREAATGDVAAYAAAQLSGAKAQLAKFTLLEERPVRIGGRPAALAVFTFIAPPYLVQQLQAFVIAQDWAYTFTFSALAEAFTDKRAEFDAILASLTFA